MAVKAVVDETVARSEGATAKKHSSTRRPGDL
jgi:hypothetical protein